MTMRWLAVTVVCVAAAYKTLLFVFSPSPDIGTPFSLTQKQAEESSEGRQAQSPAAVLTPIDLNVIPKWEGKVASNRRLFIPAGFTVTVFAAGVSGARLLAQDAAGNLYVSRTQENRISVLPDTDADGDADMIRTFAEELDRPHGLAFREGWLYVAEEDRIERLRDTDGDLVADQRELITTAVPAGGMHTTRTLGFGPDDQLYVAVGAACNACEDLPCRGAILQFDSLGHGGEIYAEGLRNAIGLVWHPDTDELWATEISRDWLGDDLPPDEINVVKEGAHYGWPYCFGDRVADPKYGQTGFCEKTEAATVEIQAHSAPLGLDFCDKCGFPAEYQGDLFVAFHGSWNRSVATGYKVVRIRLSGAKPVVEDFLTGWLVAEEKWGRPVDIFFAADGSMYVSDDLGGVIYRVTAGR